MTEERKREHKTEKPLAEVYTDLACQLAYTIHRDPEKPGKRKRLAISIMKKVYAETKDPQAKEFIKALKGYDGSKNYFKASYPLGYYRTKKPIQEESEEPK